MNYRTLEYLYLILLSDPIKNLLKSYKQYFFKISTTDFNKV